MKYTIFSVVTAAVLLGLWGMGGEEIGGEEMSEEVIIAPAVTSSAPAKRVFMPTAPCQDVTVDLDGMGNAILDPSEVHDGSLMSSPHSVSPDIFNCDSISSNPTTVTLTFIDSADNNAFAFCNADVTVRDTIPPTVHCVKDSIIVFLDALNIATIDSSMVDSMSSDACGISSMSLSPYTFDCNDVSKHAKITTLTVKGFHQDSASCTAKIYVRDTIPPIAICRADTPFIYLDPHGLATISTSDVNNGSSDNCSLAQNSLSLDQTQFGCGQAGGYSFVELTVVDASGNPDSCSVTIWIEDSISPLVHCRQHVAVQLNALGDYTLLASEIDSLSTDSCGLSLSISPNTFDCSSRGPNMVTLTGTDNRGNISTCVSNVTVEDKTPPIINCHQAITVYLDTIGNASIMESDVNDGSSDVCDGLNLSLSLSQSIFDCSHVSSASTVELTVEDNSLNTAKCTATITVKDTISPTAYCKSTPITVNLDTVGNGSITPASVRNTSPTDNCPFGSPFERLSNDTFDCDSIGTRFVTYTVIDASFNTESCQVIINVVDTIPPDITCPANVTITANSDCEATLADYRGAPTTSDNCDSNPDITQSPLAGSTIMGTNPITLTSTDSSQNSTDCTFLVIIEDSTPPQINCKDFTLFLDANGNATLFPADVTDSQEDNCTIADSLKASVVPNQFICTDLGSKPVTLTVTDANGNTSTCDATVTVEDTIPPTPECKTSITLPVGPVRPTDLDSLVETQDNCTVMDYSVAPNILTCDDVATEVSVVLTVTDNSGNSAQCATAVRVIDSSESQVTNRVPDIIRCGEQLIDWELPTAKLPCSRLAELTYMTNPAGLDKGGPFPVGTHTVTYDLLDALVSKSLFDTFLVEILPIPIIENYVTGDTITTPANETVTLAPMADAGDVAYGWKVTLSENIQASPVLPIGLQEEPITQNFSFINPRATGIAVYTIFPYYIDAVYPDTCPGDSVVVVVKVLPENIDFFIPDMFTPNGDGVNETWGITVPPSINPEDYGIEVFNKAGGLVFRASNLQARWDGDRFPDGPYWYIIVKNNSGERIRSGSVTIQR